MSDSRAKFADYGQEGMEFTANLRIQIPRRASSFLAKHAKGQGLTKTTWVRMAIREQLIRDGVPEDEVPDLKAYTGKRLRMQVLE